MDTPDFPVLEQGPGSGLEQSWFVLDWSSGQLSEAFSECSKGEKGLSECLLPLGCHLVWHAASFLHPEHGCPQGLEAFASLRCEQCLGTDHVLVTLAYSVPSLLFILTCHSVHEQQSKTPCLLLWY